jgi:flagellar biosynthetic protein FliR
VDLLVAEVVERFLAFLWPMIRISALLLAAPIFSVSAFNIRLRILLALVLTFLIYPLHDWPFVDPFSAAGLREVFVQVSIGAIMGLVLQIVTAAVVVAGQAISAAMGLAMANMIDPNLGNVPVVAQFLLVIATLLFLGLGGHLVLISILLESFRSLPIGVVPNLAAFFPFVLEWSSMIFLGGITLALPILAVMLCVNVGMGIITRAAPSLNIFAVGFPALLLVGLGILVVALPTLVFRIEGLWLQGFQQLRTLVGLS